ncbi:MAG: hypothetical protein IVW55_14140 [Chloroflexi bacterium]|nr:hypothetical protein [Chloroflexota bacterium]
MSRALFGILLAVVGVLYLFLVYQEVSPGIMVGDWVSYLGALLFLAAITAFALVGANLVRTKRR